MSPCLGHLFTELVSPSFIAQLETLTGISGLVAEERIVRGAGVHIITQGGRLGWHTDFNRYTHPKHGPLDRRINLLLYLNDQWCPEHGGELQLVHPQLGPSLPFLQHKYLCHFNTTNQSIHGHPSPWVAPPGKLRRSIAMYYYTPASDEVPLRRPSH